MFGIDWTDLQVYHYIAIGGGGLAVLAILLYFVLPRGLKIPAGIISTVAALVGGIGIGVVGMAYCGYETKKPEVKNSGGPPPDMAGMMKGPGGKGPPGGMPAGMPPGMPMPGGGGFGGKGKGGFGGKGPNNKNQLALLVTKLQQLTEKPLSITLTDAQRDVLREQLKELEVKDDLSDGEAKSRLEAILEAFADNKTTLEAAGFRWPGAGPAMQSNTPNPFMDDDNHDRLRALQKSLGQKK